MRFSATSDAEGRSRAEHVTPVDWDAGALVKRRARVLDVRDTYCVVEDRETSVSVLVHRSAFSPVSRFAALEDGDELRVSYELSDKGPRAVSGSAEIVQAPGESEVPGTWCRTLADVVDRSGDTSVQSFAVAVQERSEPHAGFRSLAIRALEAVTASTTSMIVGLAALSRKAPAIAGARQDDDRGGRPAGDRGTSTMPSSRGGHDRGSAPSPSPAASVANTSGRWFWVKMFDLSDLFDDVDVLVSRRQRQTKRTRRSTFDADADADEDARPSCPARGLAGRA